jgi:hypothetical protein
MRQRVLADGDGDAERGAELIADGAHRCRTARVLARLAAAAIQLAERRTSASRSTPAAARLVSASPTAMRPTRRVEHRERGALAHRHRLARVALVVRERQRDVGDRHLPAPDHRVARHEAADGAVADRDEERLVRDGGEARARGKPPPAAA